MAAKSDVRHISTGSEQDASAIISDQLHHDELKCQLSEVTASPSFEGACLCENENTGFECQSTEFTVFDSCPTVEVIRNEFSESIISEGQQLTSLQRISEDADVHENSDTLLQQFDVEEDICKEITGSQGTSDFIPELHNSSHEGILTVVSAVENEQSLKKPSDAITLKVKSKKGPSTSIIAKSSKIAKSPKSHDKLCLKGNKRKSSTNDTASKSKFKPKISLIGPKKKQKMDDPQRITKQSRKCSKSASKSLCQTLAAAQMFLEETPEERKKRQLLKVLQYKIKYLTKPCKVFLQKLEKMDLSKEKVEIDMTFPETLPEHHLERKIPNVERKTGKTYKPKPVVNIQSPVASPSAPKFNMSKYKAYLREKAKGCASSSGNTFQFPQMDIPKLSNSVNKARVFIKIQTPSKHGASLNSEKVIQGTKRKISETLSEQDVNATTQDDVGNTLILFDDLDDIGGHLSDESVPSDDEDDRDYKPSQSKSGNPPKKLKHGYKKRLKFSLKSRPKPIDCYLGYAFPVSAFAEVKTENESADQTENQINYVKRKTFKRKTLKRLPRQIRVGNQFRKHPVHGHFECNMCDFTASEKNLVSRHHATTHCKEWLQCAFCEAQFRSKYVRMEHEARKHTNEKPFKCPYEGCSFATKCLGDLNGHQSKHATERTHVCQLCGWTTKWVKNLRGHHLMKHTTERKFQCPHCPFTAKRNSDLKQHIHRHIGDKSKKCEICGFSVKTNWEIKSHMLTHSDEKPFQCTHPGCKAATKTRADLNKHMRIHSTDRPFRCEQCQRTYKDITSLNKHKRFMHSLSRDYKCDICNKAFKSKPTLRTHLEIHTGHKKFKCDFCPLRFFNKYNKRVHMKTHDSTNRPFPCPLCAHSAKCQNNLLAHIGTMHGGAYTYYCELCHKPFQRHSMLQTHYRRMHTRQQLKSLDNYLKNSHAVLPQLKVESSQEIEDTEGQGSREQQKSKTNFQEISSLVQVKKEIPDDEHFIEKDLVGEGESENPTSFSHSHILPEMLSHNSSSIDLQDILANARSISSNSSKFSKESQVEIIHSNDQINRLLAVTGNVDLTSAGVSKLGSNDDMLPTISDISSRPLPHVSGGSALACARNIFQSEAGKNGKPLATLAFYDGFRLPLATKGFEFNYGKNGKKPKAWFMDTDCMDAESAEKMKKYLRRKGLINPLPKRKKKRSCFAAFVQNRKRKLNEKIWKKRTEQKSNESRTARYKGTYTENESMSLKEQQLEEELVRLPATGNEKGNSSKKKKSINKVRNNLKLSTKVKGTDKKGRGRNSEKKVSNKRTKAQKIPLLSSEKKHQRQKKPNKRNTLSVIIRKPAYLLNQDGKSKSSKRILNKPNAGTKDKTKLIEKKNQNVKVTKRSSQKVLKETNAHQTQSDCATKRSYNKKYVPAKKRRKLKECAVPRQSVSEISGNKRTEPSVYLEVCKEEFDLGKEIFENDVNNAGDETRTGMSAVFEETAVMCSGSQYLGARLEVKQEPVTDSDWTTVQ